MNKYEALYRSSRMAARVIRSGVLRNLEQRRGRQPTPTIYTLLYAPIADRFGIKRGSIEEKNAKRAASAISTLWVEADAILDQDTLYSEADQEKLDRKKNAAVNGKLIIDASVPEDVREKVADMENEARKKAYEAHATFMEGFDPSKTTYEDVLDYRTKTSGLMAETIVNAICITAGNNGDITLIKKGAVNEALCLQMCDDLVDCVYDYRNRLPNLLYSLILKIPTERSTFEAAAVNQVIIDMRRPYEIAQIAAPATLFSYIQRFNRMAATLPPDRRQFVQDSLATITHFSYSPNGTVGKLSYSEIVKMLAKRTKV